MSLIARLIASAASSFGLARAHEDATAESDQHLAVTALLVHVARIDGVLASSEHDRLVKIVQARYAASRDEADALIERAAAFDAETRDITSLVELIDRDEPDERANLLAQAWSVAGADGKMHEFEEALVWRLGKLLGLDEAAIAQSRGAAGDSAG